MRREEKWGREGVGEEDAGELRGSGRWRIHTSLFVGRGISVYETAHTSIYTPLFTRTLTRAYTTTHTHTHAHTHTHTHTHPSLIYISARTREKGQSHVPVCALKKNIIIPK